MTIYHFTIHPEISIEEAWTEIEDAGIEILYSEENPDDQNKTIICRLPTPPLKNELIKQFHSVKDIGQEGDLSINWNIQWEEHGLNFYEGHVHVNIEGTNFLLKPGPGFGDASHSTTRLVLQLMDETIASKTVIDIGCGSGILSLAALKLHAQKVFAIDIDEAAIKHTKENAILNELNDKLWVGQTDALLKEDIKGACTALMNMISSEQDVAWTSLSSIHGQINELITSGILIEEKDDYLKKWRSRGWKLRSFVQENEWCAFHLVEG